VLLNKPPLLQTEDQHSRYLLSRSVRKDSKFDDAPDSTTRGCANSCITNKFTNGSLSAVSSERLPCCVSTTPAEQLQLERQEKYDSPMTLAVKAITQAHAGADTSSAAVEFQVDRSSGGWSVLADDAKAAQPSHMLPKCREEKYCDLQVASNDCTKSSGKSDAACQSEQILLDIFVRRALSAGDEMDSKIDSIRDAIRNSDSSSAWFTRWLLIMQHLIQNNIIYMYICTYIHVLMRQNIELIDILAGAANHWPI
jgi:hypothetical protein